MYKGEKLKDICPKCFLDVEDAITDLKNEYEQESKEPEPEKANDMLISDAINLLEDNGYSIVYRPSRKTKK